MKKAALLVLIIGLAQSIFCQDTITRKLDELMSAYNKLNKFNGSVLIYRKGQILLEKGYGYKDVKSNSMIDANSIFRIYSITKPFTSTLVLKLVEEGKLSLNDRVSKFYPTIPKADSITIEHLLTHTSGLYEFTRGGLEDHSEKSFIALLESKPLDFSPGTAWSYCNSGYYLLGFIIQKLTGMRYEDAIQKYIFNPLDMTHSGFDYKNFNDKNKTTGYAVFSDEQKTEAEVYPPPGPFAAGGIHSTVGDLLKYHKGLQSFKVIKEQSLQKSYTQFRNNYGYGWIISPFEGKQIISHGGGAAGFRTNLVRIPSEDICIILLANIETTNVHMIADKILFALYNKPYFVPVNIKVPLEILASYTGTYEIDTPKLTMHITVEDGKLIAQVQGQPKTILFAQKENYFYAEEANGFIEFQKDETGKVNRMILNQGGKNFTGNRTK